MLSCGSKEIGEGGSGSSSSIPDQWKLSYFESTVDTDFQELKQAVENLLRRTHLVADKELAVSAAPASAPPRAMDFNKRDIDKFSSAPAIG